MSKFWIVVRHLIIVLFAGWVAFFTAPTPSPSSTGSTRSGASQVLQEIVDEVVSSSVQTLFAVRVRRSQSPGIFYKSSVAPEWVMGLAHAAGDRVFWYAPDWPGPSIPRGPPFALG